MESFVNAHMTGSRGSVISGENVTPERRWNNNEHEKLGVVLNR
jgi:hypothetical protein